MTQVQGTEERWLRTFFSGLREQRIEYAVLRNYDSLPRSLAGSDLDVVVASDDARAAIRVISSVTADMGGALIGCGQTTSATTIHLLVPPLDGQDWWGARVDVFTGTGYRGHELFSASTILRHATSVDDLLVVEPGAANAIAACKELLHNGRIPQRYKEQTARWMAQPQGRGKQGLCDEMGPTAFAALGRLVNTPEPADKGSDVRVFKDAVRRHFLARGRLKYVSDALRDLLTKMHRYMRPSGLVVAVLGTDGAGKSAVIEGMMPWLSAATHGGVHQLHLRPGLLPPLARLVGRGSPDGGVVTEPHAARPSGLLGSLVRACYYATDYIIGYWLVIRKLVARRPDVVVFDRYCYDLLVDPRRFRVALPKQLLRALMRALPKPDLVIGLVADPQVIHDRKPELPIDEIRRQVEALEALVGSLPNGALVRTDIPVGETVDQALCAIRDALLARGPKGCS